ncbi:16S rRNA (uracil(1498)-N(3))-methyltransferase [Microbacterium sp. LRZ72]|uniref:16S rRNA (uracil(1498)-N(3))-methyltransferase n=1 Tax=Microbacterium sp. LRZ72 TaxID=2942481 RepID=UPI0029BA784C|nr:16S rRNA (uracil(1498)-N(3))-methyltransferase [Microbacterium sp. LRZ72]MDX2375463.1 16S rRNA (uracil(1498)-N(3))-methyltransferase [Microbacterium sp. LRZ72]
MALHFVTADAGAASDVVRISGDEARHAATVRRVRPGEHVTVGDGRGAWIEGECVSVSPALVEVRVHSTRTIPAASPRLVLVQALAKGDHDERAAQAACELGADVIEPWQAARSVSRWEGAKRDKGRSRWASIVREAAKQSHRAWIPDVADVSTTAGLVDRCSDARVYLLEPTALLRLSAQAPSADDPRDVVLIVGPEGGVAPDEIAALTDAGALPVRLGETVLRTSTAGPAAIALLNVALGRW